MEKSELHTSKPITTGGMDPNEKKYDEISYGIVPVSKDHKFVLITQAKSGPWGFAKGHGDDGEDGIETAIRENKEEIGIEISKDDLIDDGEFTADLEYTFDVTPEMLEKHLKKMAEKGEKPHVAKAGPSHRLLRFYVALIEKIEPSPDKDEVLDSKWVSWDEAIKIMKGKAGYPESNQLTILQQAQKRVVG